MSVCYEGGGELAPLHKGGIASGRVLGGGLEDDYRLERECGDGSVKGGESKGASAGIIVRERGNFQVMERKDISVISYIGANSVMF